MSFTIEYDQNWLATDIKTNINKLKGKTACLIFLDYSSKIPKFYPLRICKIQDTIPPTDGVTYQFVLITDDFIIPLDSQKFNSEVYKSLQERNLLAKDSAGNEIVSNLVLSGDRTILEMMSMGSNQQNIWAEIIEYLVKAGDIKRLENQPQFRESTFFRLKILPRSELKSPLIPKEHLYDFDQGKEYCLVLSVYHPHFKNFQKDNIRKLVINFDSKLISHVGSVELDLPLRQRKYTKYFDFHVKEPIISGKSRLVIHGDGDDFNAPSVQLSFVLSTKKKGIIGVIGGLGIGIFILGAIDILTNSIASLFQLPPTESLLRTRIGLALAIIGTALSTLPIAWLELKRRII